jgi:protein involved in polysaccharide export with SLBB domain
MKRLVLVYVLIASCLLPAFTQGIPGTSSAGAGAGAASLSGAGSPSGFFFEELSRVPEGRALLAMTTPDYPVTPGDIYTLSFLKATEAASQSLVVENDFRVNMGVFGMLNARGLSFIDFKRQVEDTVSRGYPGSSPQLVVRSTGVFQVQLIGEVTSTGLAQAWALTRLSSVFSSYQTVFSSERNVRVRSVDGQSRQYDLFKARRDGDLGQDPYLKPGDTVVLSKADRRISISGEVKRPGTYQLLPGENLRALIDRYAEGFLPSAMPSHTTITKRPTLERPEGEARIVDASRIDFTMSEGDTVSIAAREQFLPVVYVEGAIAMGEDLAAQHGTDRYTFRPGLRLSQVVRSVAARIQPNADLKRAFVTRKGAADSIPVNLEKLLYGYNQADDILLEAEDRIVIPRGSLDVFVTGEVKQASWVNVMALTRLSQVLGDLSTEFSSIRDIIIRSASGEERSFDLFRAQRYGELDQDPYLSPGDTVVVARVQRRVSVNGEVKRPGTYQLLPNENLRALIDVYAEGFLPSAKPDHATVTRRPTQAHPEGESRVFDASRSELAVSDGDAIAVSARDAFLPVVYVEGAITMGEDLAAQHGTDRYTFRPGLQLSQVVRSVATRIQPNADLKRAFVTRKGAADSIPVNLEKLLYAYNQADDILLEAEDRIVIPRGSLDVFVTGEVKQASWVNVMALSRLSQVLGDLSTEYSSIRNIQIRSAAGEERSFDLFRAQRYGELDQDPYLAPGDMVMVDKADRRVRISGEVKRPGTYQLLPGENLFHLITSYAQGFTDLSDSTRVRITRMLSPDSKIGELLYVDGSTDAGLQQGLEDLDSVVIASKQEFRPTVFFEGAVGTGVPTSGSAAELLDVSNRVRYTYHPGTRLSEAVLNLRGQFSAVSDLERAYLRRAAGGSVIPVNLEDFLHRYDFSDDVLLEPNDVIIVPFRQFFVTVSGSVYNPGRYPYVPDRSWAYYVSLAGGLNDERNNGRGQKVYNYLGEKRSLDEPIQPEDRIIIPANSFLYNFGRVSTILTTTISVVSLVIGIMRLW